MKKETESLRSLEKFIMPGILNNPNVSIKALVLMRLYRMLRHKSRSQLFYESVVSELKQNPQINVLFPQETVRKHYVYENMRDTLEHPDLFLTQIRFFKLYEYFKRNFPEIFEEQTTVLNVGDTSGILFKAMNRKSTSLNINKECVDFIRTKGIEAVVGDAENIQFPDKSFEYIFSFQCLEHLPNPIRALNEMGRVARKKVFVSIPYTDRTIIYNIKYWLDLKKMSWKEDSVKDVDCHIFEFSTSDFKNVLTYTNLQYEANWPIKYFCEDSLRGRLLNQYFRPYCNFFVLQPAMRRNIL